MYKLLAITNRHLCNNDFLEQIRNICTLNNKIKKLYTLNKDKELYTLNNRNKELYTSNNSTMISSVSIVLREKDLSENDYKALAEKVLKVCKENNTKCILHTYYKTAIELNCKKIHLPLHVLKSTSHISREFDEIGVSIHSVDEAIEAVNLGATYITAGHIFATDCKKDLPPRGLSFLSAVCNSVSIPVYGIGGISPEKAKEVIEAGAAGICIMSGLMNCKDFKTMFNL